jgi:hypothetical protein
VSAWAGSLWCVDLYRTLGAVVRPPRNPALNRPYLLDTARASGLATSAAEGVTRPLQGNSAGGAEHKQDHTSTAAVDSDAGTHAVTADTQGTEVNDVTEFAEPAAATVDPVGDSSKRLTLERLLVGSDAVLVRCSDGRVPHTASGSIFETLRQHGCGDTEHLLQLLDYCGSADGGALGTRERNVAILMQMGIGAFHAMELLKCVERLPAAE